MKKFIKGIAILFSILGCMLLTGCIDKSDPMYIIYSYATETGYDDSYTAWKKDFEGDKLAFRIVDENFEWKMNSDSSWNLLTENTGEDSWGIKLSNGDLGYTVTQYYSVIFNTNYDFNIDTVLVVDGEKVTQPAELVREFYVFQNWLKGETAFDFDSAITSKTTLNAHWTIDGILFNEFTWIDDVPNLKVSNTVDQIDLADYLESETSWKVLSNDDNTIVDLAIGDNSFTVENEEDDSNGNNTYVINVRRLAMIDVTINSTFVNRDNTTKTITVEEDTVLSISDLDLVIEGFTFEVAAGYDDAVTSAVTIEVTYTGNDYTITFNSDGGSDVEQTSVTFDNDIELPIPTKFRHTFLGWTYDNELLDSTFTYNIPANATLIASWKENDYTIDYDLAGGVNSDDNTYGYDENNSEISLSDATRLGYIFVGWFDRNDTKYTSIPANSSSNITLTAKWEAKQYTVTLDLDGGTGDTSYTATYDAEYLITAPTKTDWVFVGWFDENEVQFSPAGVWTLDDDLTLTAHWVEFDYLVFYDLDNGINSLSNPQGYDENNAEITLYDATKTGYTFLGWYFEDDKYTKIEANSTTVYTFTAKWEANEYTVTYDVNGGYNLSNKTFDVVFDESFELSVTSKTGYVFIGWYSGDTLVTDDSVWKIDSNTTLVAKWEEAEFTIEYVIGDGVLNVVNAGGYDSGNSFQLADGIAPEGYTFTAWYTDEELTNEISGITAGNNTDLTIYAKYTPNEYTITYNVNGGIELDDNNDTVTFDNENVLVTPEKTGYAFVGWSLVVNGAVLADDHKWDIAADGTELFARWEIVHYTITYELNYGDNNVLNVSTYTYEDEVVLYDPTRQLDTFTGWELNSEVVDGLDMNTTGNKILTATWEATVYTIIYELNDGEVSAEDPQTYSFDDSNVELNRPVKEGFYFAFWSLESRQDIDATILSQDIIKRLLELDLIIDNEGSYSFVLDANYTNDPMEEIFFVEGGSTYIYYGYYPQTVEDDTTIITALSKISSTNENGYIEYAGEEYVKKTAKVYDTYYFMNGTRAYNNTTYYFRVEPIKWKVISTNPIQVVSDLVLDNVPYFTESSTIDSEDEIYENNYKDSNLRSFLNNEFMSAAFTSAKLDNIETTLVNNTTSSATGNDDYLCEDTNDKIYTLSYDDVFNENYGFEDKDTSDTRNTVASDYAIANEVRLSSSANSYALWWLRTPSSVSNKTLFIDNLGAISEGTTTFIYYGVRPVFTFISAY